MFMVMIVLMFVAITSVGDNSVVEQPTYKVNAGRGILCLQAAWDGDNYYEVAPCMQCGAGADSLVLPAHVYYDLEKGTIKFNEDRFKGIESHIPNMIIAWCDEWELVENPELIRELRNAAEYFAAYYC